MSRQIRTWLLAALLGGLALTLRDCILYIPYDILAWPETVDVVVEDWYVEPWPVIDIWGMW